MPRRIIGTAPLGPSDNGSYVGGVLVAALLGLAWLALMVAVGSALSDHFGPLGAIGAPLTVHALLAAGFVGVALITPRNATRGR